MEHEDIFEPFERLIRINLEGREVDVPENNSILRCLQYIDMETISLAELCWNGECSDCQVWIESNGKENAAMSCRTKAADGMVITRISDTLR